MQPTATHQVVIIAAVALVVLSHLATGAEGKWTFNHGDANFVSAIRAIIKAQLTPAIAEIAKTDKITKLDTDACRLSNTPLGKLFKILVYERYDQARTILLEYVYKQVMKEHDDTVESNPMEQYRELMRRIIYVRTIIEYCAYRIDYSTNEREKDKIGEVLMNLHPKSKSNLPGTTSAEDKF